MDHQITDKIDKLEQKLDQLERDLKTRFEKAAKLFDLLNDRVKTAGHTSLQDGMNDECSQVNLEHVVCLYHDGKRYFCMQHARRMTCILSDISRPPGFDICFSDGIECKHLSILD